VALAEGSAGAIARRAAALAREKIPMFLLAAAASIVVLDTQRTMGAREVAAWLPAATQAAIVLESFGWYLMKAVWPSGLAALYPVPTTPPPLWPAVLSALAILLLTALALAQVRKRPYLAVGWLWFLGMLVPVAGIVHVGVQSRADRWMYLPMIGLSIGAAFGLADVAARSRTARRVVLAASLAALAALTAVSYVQVGYWRDTIVVFERAAAVTRENYYAWDRLAQEHRAAGRFGLAEPAYLRALLYAPRWTRPRQQLADMWDEQGDARAASALRGLAPQPWSAPYGTAAIGVALVRGGRLGEARPFVEDALAREPRSAELHTALAVILAREGDRRGAEEHYAAALDLEPRLYSTAANLAWLRATASDPARRRPDDAAALAARALADLRGLEPALLDALAAAHAASGRFADAIAVEEQALAAAERAGAPALVESIRARLARYRAGQPPASDSDQWRRP
jgi:tetratricopeptide (TPR) repeat protein